MSICSGFISIAIRALRRFLPSRKHLPCFPEAPLFSHRQRAPVYVLLFYLLTDALAFILAFVAALETASIINRVFLQQPLGIFVTAENLRHLFQFASIAGGVLLWFGYKRHYRVRMPFWQEAKDIVTGAVFAMIIDGFLQFATKEDFSRLWLMLGWFYFALGVIALRMVLRHFLRRFGLWQVPALFIGHGLMAKNVLAALKSEPGIGYEITTQIDSLLPALAQVENSWKALCSKHGADYVIIALDAVELKKAEEALAQIINEKIPFSIAPPLPSHMPVSAMEPHYFYDNDMMFLVPLKGLQQPMPRFIKRTLDVVVAAVALILLVPLLVALSFIIKADGGPALFGHQRLGRNGKPFSCLKFRSMVINSEAALKDYLSKNPSATKEWQEEWKLRDDPRITRIGHFIRKWSLDELPQLINVLRGEMSLVGPRPVVLQETLKYSDDVQYYYSVRPGLTGLWQVSGRNDVSYAARVHMDSWYVRNWSVWHDLVILLKTVRVLINRSGAY